jgi:hypothetical protein
MEFPPGSADRIAQDFELMGEGLLRVPQDHLPVRVRPPAGTVRPVARGVFELQGQRRAMLPFDARLNPHHVPRHEPLFQGDPVLADMQQQHIGDCWFLSALAAIVGVGTGKAIMLMMRSFGDTVVVRLFDQQLTPHFIELKKSLLTVDPSAGLMFHSRGQLWAPMLEKAMTAIENSKAYVEHVRRTGERPEWQDTTGRFDPPGASYGRLEAGLSHIAFQALLGVQAQMTTINIAEHHHAPPAENHFRNILGGDADRRPPQQVMVQLFSTIVYPAVAEQFYELVWEPWIDPYDPAFNMQPLRGLHDTAMGAKINNAQGKASGKVYRFEDFQGIVMAAATNPLHVDRWNRLVQRFTTPPPNNRVPAQGAVRARAQPILQREQLRRPGGVLPQNVGPQGPPTLQQALLSVCNWVRQQQIFSGVRGSGVYTVPQVQLYDQIAAHLWHHRPVCLSTRPVVGRPAQGGGDAGYAGEQKSKGLAGQHAYAVLECYHDQVAGTRYVKVHNPWGIYGRGYEFAPDWMRPQPTERAHQQMEARFRAGLGAPKTFESNAGTFWLELSDLTKRCSQMYTCTDTSPVIVEGRLLAGERVNLV